MTTKTTIIDAIKKITGDRNYHLWRIGLTHDLSKRRQEWKDVKGHDVKYWRDWAADSLAEAEHIETYFINTKGMKGGTGGNLSSGKAVYVYIF